MTFIHIIQLLTIKPNLDHAHHVEGLDDDLRPRMVATTAWGLGPAIQGTYRPPFRGGEKPNTDQNATIIQQLCTNFNSSPRAEKMKQQYRKIPFTFA